METEQFWPWLAGFLDGEGCFYIVNANRGSSNYAPKINVSLTHKETLDMIQSKIGGNIVEKKRSNPNWQPCWAWTLSGTNKVNNVLENIHPYLMTKAKQGWLMREFIAQRTNQSGAGKHMTDEEMALREGFRLAISGINGNQGKKQMKLNTEFRESAPSQP